MDLLLTVVLCFVAAFGLAIGSFLNVVIWRVPRGESIVAPGSRCPTCGVPLGAKDNIPLVSWLLLKGRCRGCREPISPRYPLVELTTAGVFVLLTWRLGLSPVLPAFLYLGAVGVCLAMIDIDVKRLPDVIVLPSYVVVLALLVVAAVAGGEWADLRRSIIGGAVSFAFYFLLIFVYPAGMGFGDVKLSGVLGLCLGWLGWGELVVGIFGGFLLGGLGAVVILVTRSGNRKSMLPFGPYMLAAVLVAIVAGSTISNAYLEHVLHV